MYCDDLHDLKKTISLKIFKYDNLTGLALPGAVFRLISDCGGITNGTTNSEGVVKFQLTPCETYELKEITPPMGYLPNTHIYEICADTCGCIFADGVPIKCLEIGNLPITGSFTALKVNIENDQPLSGALYTLYLDGVPISSVYSDENGAITFENLMPGQYTLTEAQPPAGFQNNPSHIPVTVASDGTVTILGEEADGFKIFDVPLMAFTFLKQDAATGNPIEGAEFELTEGGMFVASATTDANGIADFGIISPGIYELAETLTPTGFLPNTHIYEVAIGADGTITVDGVPLGSFTVKNVEIPGFSFIKSDIDAGLPLAGAVFELRQNGNLIDTSVSDMTGFVSFSGLLPGTYQLTEIIPPQGYTGNPTTYTVIVSGTGTVTIDGMPAEDFSVSDQPIILTVLKTDSELNPLADASYSLSLYGTIVNTQTSGLDGIMTFTGITPASYILSETVAPEGFALNTTEYEVDVSETGVLTVNGLITNSITITNTPLPEPPVLLGWMRSSETVGYVPGARIPNIPPADDVFNGWNFSWVRDNTPLQFFDNSEVLDAAISGEYTLAAMDIPENLFNPSGIVVDETYVWDGGSGHQFFTGYFNGAVTGGWASWANLEVPSSLISPETEDPVAGGYTPYHYSLRRFTTYLDVDLSSYTVEEAFLVSEFPSGVENEFVFPLNDSIFVFVNGVLAYWTSTDLIGSDNIAQNRLYFEGLQGVFMDKDPVYAFTDGWYLTLGGAANIANLAPYLRNGKNVIDVIADDYYFGGGMSKLNAKFSISPI